MDLSSEVLLDYACVASIIKNTSFLETLILPKLRKESAETILDILNEATIENSTLTDIKLNLSQFGNSLPPKMNTICKKIRSRLERNKKRIFAIHGGGYIGLGLMADIISQSPFEYNIVATSSDKFTNLLINSNHQFWIQHDDGAQNKKTCVNNINMIYSRHSKNIENLYLHANIMAICLTEEGVLASANQIAKGLIERYKHDQAGLKIFVLMNKPDCAKFIKKQVFNAMLQELHDQDYCKRILANIRFIPTMVDRIVSKIDRKLLLQQLKKQISNQISLTNCFDRKRSKEQQIDELLSSPLKLIKMIKRKKLQFNLFNAELSFVLYAPNDIPEIPRLPAIKAVKNLDQYISLKNKFINGPHATLAWLGGLMGYDTIASAIKNPYILTYIQEMMKYEIAPILQAEYPDIKQHEFEFLKSTFLKHCKSSTHDPIIRVARDPLRKLIKDGCIRGVLDLHKKHSLKIATPRLEGAIAAGILYAIKQIDPNNSECQKIQNIFNKSNNVMDIICYTGPYGKGSYPGYVYQEDYLLVNRILNKFKQLEIRTDENYQYQNESLISRKRFYTQQV
ncbi:mannitol dehydrogenase family protein [Candidatus Berkiella aquae]|nr:hypothetical protein [Candidatus Berkiella aquae]MCS5709855.1 hypothetical protein [Candidatus Berkiella aquae]